MAGDTLVEHQAILVEPGDLVYRIDDLYRCYEVEQHPHQRRVTLHLEACRHGDWNLPATAIVSVERLS